jgi:hypothetical protein
LSIQASGFSHTHTSACAHSGRNDAIAAALPSSSSTEVGAHSTASRSITSVSIERAPSAPYWSR